MFRLFVCRAGTALKLGLLEEQRCNCQRGFQLYGNPNGSLFRDKTDEAYSLLYKVAGIQAAALGIFLCVLTFGLAQSCCSVCIGNHMRGAMKASE
jgi:hypothetical protein